MHKHCVAKWMSMPPIVALPTTTLAEAQRLMERHHIRRLPVVQDGRLVGIVTWGDLRAAWPSAATTLSAYEWRALLAKATVAECMTRNPITIAPDTSVLYAAQLMLTYKISGLPVVEDGHVVGMITESDLFRLIISESIGAGPDDAKRALPLWQVAARVSENGS
jgi:CBS domain-containing protein